MSPRILIKNGERIITAVDIEDLDIFRQAADAIIGHVVDTAQSNKGEKSEPTRNDVIHQMIELQKIAHVLYEAAKTPEERKK